MQKRPIKTLITIILIAVLTFAAGYSFGKKGFEIEIKKNPPEITILNKTPKDQTVDFSIFWQAWDLLWEKHLNQPLEAQKLLYGALRGLTSAVGDPYTAFLTPEQNKMLEESLNGEYEGIGAELGIRDSQLLIIAPLEGSPAEKAGVKAGDKILKIEGEEATGITLTEAVAKIRGKAGTVSTLTLKRDDKEFEVKIKRARITIASVKWEEKEKNVVYIRLSRFGERTNNEWSKVIREIKYQIPTLKAIILDLRGNPGGFLQGSVFIASEFLKKGEIVVKEEFADGKVMPLKTTREGGLANIPIIVLIDKGSASASEIVAAALREYRGAVLVGETSFGKGTVQDAEDLPEGCGLHITVAKWLTPQGVWINEEGLKPDYEVSRTEKDVEEGKDPQLEKALEIALKL